MARGAMGMLRLLSIRGKGPQWQESDTTHLTGMGRSSRSNHYPVDRPGPTPYHSPMSYTELRQLLAGGDRRSIGRADEVVPRAKDSPSVVSALVRLMRDSDPVVSMRAADALEKISRTDPEVLMPHKHELLGEIAENSQQEVRWHLLQMLPRLRLIPTERTQALEIAAGSLHHPSRIVVADALTALFKLSAGDAVLMERAKEQADRLSSSTFAAVRSRAKRLVSSACPKGSLCGPASGDFEP